MKNTASLIIASLKYSLPHVCNVFIGYLGIKKLAISCFHCLQNDEVIDFDQFVGWFEFQYNNWNQHYESPLCTKFQLHTLFHHQEIVNFVFLLSSKWWRRQIRSILTVGSNFNTMTEISIISFLYLANFIFILHFVTKILAISCFHCHQNDDVIKFNRFWFEL